MKRTVPDPSLIEALDKVYDAFHGKGGTKLYADNRLHLAASAAFESWFNTDWMPRMKKCGWKYWAVLLPTKVIGQMNMKRFVEQVAALGVTVRAFEDPDEATKWLESCN